ncbi:MAG: hypothetical protein V8S72_02100 [Oscillospiraceae bacterium]
MKSMFYVSICLLLAMAMLLGGCGSPAVSEITAENTDKIAADPAALTEETTRRSQGAGAAPAEKLPIRRRHADFPDLDTLRAGHDCQRRRGRNPQPA